MADTSYLGDFTRNWRQRQGALAARGLTMEDIAPVVRFDFQRVQNGSQPLGDPEAGELVAEHIGGNPVITNPQNKTGIQDILGNAAKDIVPIAKGLNPIHLIPAMVKDISNIPSKGPAAIGEVLHQFGQHHYAEALQDVGKVPGLAEAAIAADFIPGVNAVAAPATAALFAAPVIGKALTGPGRQELMQHPLAEGINLLPALHVKTPFAKTAIDATGKVVEVPAVLDAAGNVIREAGPKVIEHATPMQFLANTQKAAQAREAVANRLRPFGMDKQSRIGNVATAVANRETALTAKRVMGEVNQEMGGLTPESYKDVQTYLERRQADGNGGFVPPPNPNLQAAADAAVKLIDENRRHPHNATEIIDIPLTSEGKLPALSADGTTVADPGAIVGSVPYSANTRLAKMYRGIEGMQSTLIDSLSTLDSHNNAALAAQDQMTKFGHVSTGSGVGAPTWDQLAYPVEGLVTEWRNPIVHSFEANADKVLGAKVSRFRQNILPALADALKNGNEKNAISLTARGLDLLNDIGPELESTVPTTEALTKLRTDLNGYGARVDGYAKASTAYDTAMANANTMAGSIARLKRRIDHVFNTAGMSLRNKGPDMFEPLVGDQLRSDLTQRATAAHARGELSAEELSKTTDAINAGLHEEINLPILGVKSWEALKADHMRTWQKLWSEGFRPAYVHKVTEAGVHQMFNPRLGPSIDSIGQLKNRAWDFTPGVQNMLLSLTHAAMEHHIFDIQHNLVFNELPKTGYILARKDAVQKMRDSYPNMSAEELKRNLQQNYVTFDPKAYVNFGRSHIGTPRGMEEMLIQRDFAKNLQALVSPVDAFSKFSNKALRLHYASVFFGPRHMAHILFSTMGMMMAESGIAPVIKYFRDANAFLKTGELPGEMGRLSSREMAQIPRGGTMVPMEQITHQLQAGVDIGRTGLDKMMGTVEKGTHPLRAARDLMAKVEEWTSDMGKAMEYLYTRDGGGLGPADKADFLRLSPDARHQRGVEYVSKVFTNFDDASAMERQMMRSIFPFYAWCLDDRSECLTQRGWLNGTELREDDTILSAKPDGALVWSGIKSIFRADYTGPMIEMKGRQLDALVTPRHSWLCTDGELRKAENLRKADTIRMMGGPLVGQPEVFADAFVEVVGWAITEGHYKRNSSGNITTIEISQKAGTPTEDEIRCSLKRVGGEWHEFLAGVGHKIRYFGVTGPLAQVIQRVAPGRVMTPDFILGLSAYQRQMLLDVMIRANGSQAVRGKGDRPTFVQKDRAAVDAFVMLATLQGWVTNTRLRSGYSTVTLKSTTTAQVRHLSRKTVPYSGMVWCPETEYGTFVYRRNGKVSITGNTRHVMRSVFRLTMDHPIRVAAVEHFAGNELADHEAGLPLQWQSLLHIGKPDSKGGQLVIDGKSLNPFRDVGNYFTLAGLVSSLNPAFEGILSSLGVDNVTGTPEAYPEQTYDPVSGRLVTKRHNAVAAMLSSYIPQTQAALDAVTGAGDKGDPAQARQRLLAQTLNMPWTPYKVDPAKRQVATEHARHKAAHEALTGALRSGNFDEVRRYNLVPFRGALVDPRRIEAWYRRLEAQNTTSGANRIATRALLPNA